MMVVLDIQGKYNGAWALKKAVFMPKYLVYLLFILSTALVFSCKTTKKLGHITARETGATASNQDSALQPDAADFADQVYRKLEQGRIAFNTFSAKIKVDVQQTGNKKNELNAFLRIKKDSAIWVTVNAMLGIEAFRMLITTDSVKILDKLNKTYRGESIAYFQELTQFPFDYYALQDLLLGNPVILTTNKTDSIQTKASYNSNEALLLFTILNAWSSNDFTISSDYYLVLTNQLKALAGIEERSCLLSYFNYVKQDNKFFPTNRKIQLTGNNWLELHLEFKQYSFNEALTFPFTVPKNYQEHNIQ